MDELDAIKVLTFLMKVIQSAWHIIVLIVGGFYFVFKLSMKNAILEAVNKLDERFVKKDVYDEHNKSVEQRLKNGGL